MRIIKHLGTGHKVQGRLAEIGGGSSIFKLMKRLGHLNIGHVYRVGQIKIEHSSETSLIQETEEENLLREWDFRPLCDTVFLELPGDLLTAPPDPS